MAYDEYEYSIREWKKPHYTASQVADILTNNPVSKIDPADVEMMVGEPVGSDEPDRAVRLLEMEDGTVYKLTIEKAD